MVVSEDCHGTALHKGLETAYDSELRTLNIIDSAFASNITTDYVNNKVRRSHDGFRGVSVKMFFLVLDARYLHV